MGPRLDACGATAMRRTRPAPASPDGGTYARRYHDREQANDCGHGQDRRPAECNLARSDQDFAYWCHGWGEAPWAPPLVEMTGGIVGTCSPGKTTPAICVLLTWLVVALRCLFGRSPASPAGSGS